MVVKSNFVIWALAGRFFPLKIEKAPGIFAEARIMVVYSKLITGTSYYTRLAGIDGQQLHPFFPRLFLQILPIFPIILVEYYKDKNAAAHYKTYFGKE